jgi:hydroxymethylpyrimidine kinase/phosphomethylpyrimidine kinase
MKSADQPVCLSIAGLDPSGGAGIIVDVRTFRAMGCYPAAAVTSITFQNTTGVFGVERQTAECLRGQVQAVIDDLPVAAVKTGVLPSQEIIAQTARLIAENGLRNIVIDPVLRSTSGFELIDEKALTYLIRLLFPLSDLVTPNIPEAEFIAKISIRDDRDIERAARIIHSMGAKNVLIKGGHAIEAKREGAIEVKMRGSNGKRLKSRARDHLFVGDSATVFDGEYFEIAAAHGTGCALSAAIAANLALGRSLVEAVGKAKEFVAEAIRTAPGLGRGNSPINI